MQAEWPPEYVVLPDNSGLIRDDIAPCRKCGLEMVVVETETGLKYQCPTCVRRKPHHRVLGRLNRDSGRILPIRKEYHHESRAYPR